MKPRTATEILEAQGYFRKHPERKRDPAPKSPCELSHNPPEWMNAEQRKAWVRIRQIIPDGVAMVADALWVEMVAVLWCEFQSDAAAMPNPRLARLAHGLSKLGLDPTSRLNLALPATDTDDEF